MIAENVGQRGRDRDGANTGLRFRRSERLNTSSVLDQLLIYGDCVTQQVYAFEFKAGQFTPSHTHIRSREDERPIVVTDSGGEVGDLLRVEETYFAGRRRRQPDTLGRVACLRELIGDGVIAELGAQRDRDNTVVVLRARDRSELHGFIRRVEGLWLELISVVEVDKE